MLTLTKNDDYYSPWMNTITYPTVGNHPIHGCAPIDESPYALVHRAFNLKRVEKALAELAEENPELAAELARWIGLSREMEALAAGLEGEWLDPPRPKGAMALLGRSALWREQKLQQAQDTKRLLVTRRPGGHRPSALSPLRASCGLGFYSALKPNLHNAP